MLDRVREAAACAWSDLLGGEHRWCVRGALALGAVLGWLANASLCQVNRNGVPHFLYDSQWGGADSWVAVIHTFLQKSERYVIILICRGNTQ